jgi:hypothetical protein
VNGILLPDLLVTEWKRRLANSRVLADRELAIHRPNSWRTPRHLGSRAARCIGAKDMSRVFEKSATHEMLKARELIAGFLHEKWPTFKGKKPSDRDVANAEAIIQLLEAEDLLIVNPDALDGG